MQAIENAWRRVPESNRSTRICNPLRNLSANPPEQRLIRFSHLWRQAGLVHLHILCVKRSTGRNKATRAAFFCQTTCWRTYTWHRQQ